MRAESAGSFTNRCSSSVNGVNEEWEQPKCAEMKEVPPHCLGCCSPSPPHSPHRQNLDPNQVSVLFAGAGGMLLCCTSAPPDANPIFFNPLCT